MAFLIVRALSKSYAVGDRRLPVLRELDLTVDEGEMVAVGGASGIGKSTLLHCVGGLDAIDGGSVTIAGTELSSAGDDARVAFRNRHIGFVFQFHHLLPEFSAVENVAMPLRIARAARGEAHRWAEALLREVGLGERMTHRPGMLSTL
jgi:lipoprotein-releasing system ATP-binding protein